MQYLSYIMKYLCFEAPELSPRSEIWSIIDLCLSYKLLCIMFQQSWRQGAHRAAESGGVMWLSVMLQLKSLLD